MCARRNESAVNRKSEIGRHDVGQTSNKKRRGAPRRRIVETILEVGSSSFEGGAVSSQATTGSEDPSTHGPSTLVETVSSKRLHFCLEPTRHLHGWLNVNLLQGAKCDAVRV